MVLSDGMMCAVTAGLAVAVVFLGTPAWLLLSAAVVTGISNAFYTPSSGTIPRRLVPGAALGKAMAGRSIAGQLVSTLGAPLGGVVVAAAGLAAAAGLNSASFAVIFVMLMVARRRFAAEVRATARSGPLLKRALAGAGLAARDSLLRPLLLVLAAVALCMLPVTSLLIPLLVRSHGWPASVAGEILGVEAVLSGVVVVVVLVRGTSERPGVGVVRGGYRRGSRHVRHGPAGHSQQASPPRFDQANGRKPGRVTVPGRLSASGGAAALAGGRSSAAGPWASGGSAAAPSDGS
jgi:MFS family permease